MRPRLLIATVMLTVAAIAAFFVPAATALAAAEREAQVVELQREATDAAARVSSATLDRTRFPDEQPRSDGDGDGDNRLEAGEPGHRYSVYGPSGHLLDGSGPANADAVVRAAVAGSSGTGRVGLERVAAIPLAGGGAIRAAEPASEADGATRRAVAGLALQALVVLILAVIAAGFLSQRLTRPLGVLRRSAARLGGGDFASRSEPTGLAEIDEVAAVLATSADRIGALVARERQLTADVSHQLRTPITGFRLAVEAELADPRPDRTQVLEEVLGAADRLDAMVVSLTRLAREAPTGQAVDLDTTIADAVHRWHQAFDRKGRSLSAAGTTGRATMARRPAVDTVLDVVLENALQHGEGTVTVDAIAHRSSVTIAIGDGGSCELDGGQAFERHRSGSGGTGIGLDLARTLTEAEGGRLRLVDRSPTTFELQVPLVPEPDLTGAADR